MQTRWVGYVVALSALTFVNVASATPKVPAGDAAPAAPAKPKATKIKVSIDGTEMGLVIAPVGPAFIGDDRWSHALAIVATGRTASSLTFNVAAFPKGDDRATITNERVIRAAALKQQVGADEAISIVPGKGLPRALFGATPPKRITITWVAN